MIKINLRQKILNSCINTKCNIFFKTPEHQYHAQPYAYARRTYSDMTTERVVQAHFKYVRRKGRGSVNE